MPKEGLEYVTTMKSTVRTTDCSIPTLKSRVIYQYLNSDTPKKIKKSNPVIVTSYVRVQKDYV